jgi:hypothetical protein
LKQSRQALRSVLKGLGQDVDRALGIRSRAQPTNSACSAAQPRQAPRLSQFPGRFNIYIYIYWGLQWGHPLQCQYANLFIFICFISLFVILHFLFLFLFNAYTCIQYYILNMSWKLILERCLGQLTASVLHGLEQLQGRSCLSRHGSVATGATGTRSGIVRRTSASEHG